MDRMDPENRKRQLAMQAQTLQDQGMQNNALQSPDPAVQAQGVQQGIQAGHAATQRQPGAVMPTMPDIPDLSATPGGTGGRAGAQARRIRRSSEIANEARGQTQTQAETQPVTPAQQPADSSDAAAFGVGEQAPAKPQEVAPAAPVMQTATTVSREYSPKSEKERELEAKAAKSQQEFLEVKTEQAKLEAEERRKQTQLIADQQEAMAERQAAIDAKREEALGRFDQAIQQYDNMEIKNPWSNKSTGAKIMAALSVGLSGFASRMSGGQGNPAMDIINKQIQQDIDIQKANLDKKKSTMTALQQYGNQLRQMGLDDQAVRESMIAMGEKKLASQLKGFQAQLGENDPRSPALAEMAAQFDQQALNRETKNRDKVKTTVTPLVPDTQKKETLDKTRLDNLETAEGNIKAYANLKKKLKDPKFREKIGKISGNWNRFKAAWLGDAEAASLMAETDRALLQALRAATGAQMTDAERQFIAQTMPSFTENIESFEAKLNDRFNESLESYKTYRNRYGKNFDVSGFVDPSELGASDDDEVGFE